MSDNKSNKLASSSKVPKVYQIASYQFDKFQSLQTTLQIAESLWSSQNTGLLVRSHIQSQRSNISQQLNPFEVQQLTELIGRIPYRSRQEIQILRQEVERMEEFAEFEGEQLVGEETNSVDGMPNGVPIKIDPGVYLKKRNEPEQDESCFLM